MNFFRTHITRSFNVGLLLSGLVFYFMKPVSDSSNHDAFTSWLQSNLKSSSNTLISDQIKGLQAENVELETIIREASILVKTHSEDFELPVDPKSNDEDEVFQVLLKEWKAFQNSSSGMSKAVIIKQAQPLSILPIDGLSFGSKSLPQQNKQILVTSTSSFEQVDVPLLSYHISPLSGGTAIGAP